MSKVDREIVEAFRAAGLRPTAQRYAVLDFLVSHPVHSTAEDILLAVNRADPRASRATVYNNLNALVRAGLVRQLAGDGKASRFDACLRRHHHFVCEQCGDMEDIDWFDVASAAARAAVGRRRIRTCEVVFRGTCARCGTRAETERL